MSNQQKPVFCFEIPGGVDLLLSWNWNFVIDSNHVMATPDQEGKIPRLPCFHCGGLLFVYKLEIGPKNINVICIWSKQNCLISKRSKT